MRVIFVLLLALSFNLSAASPPAESFARLNAPFPDILFADPDRKSSRLSNYRGKVVLVKLWATWCGVCQAKWPAHQALYDAVEEEPKVQVITLSVLEDPQTSQDWVNEQGFDVPLFKNPVTDRGAVRVADDSYIFIKGTPMVFLIDKNGILRKKAVGASQSITETDIRGLI